MALVTADRVKEASIIVGTGTATLLGAVFGFQSFAVIGNGNTTYYCIAGQGTNEWEVGIGTYTLSGTTLARTTVLSNSSATQPSALSFSAGTKDVFVTYPSSKGVYLDASGNAIGLGTPAAFVATNATGTASININGTVGATTPAAGAFTTLSATGITTVAAGTALLPAIVSTTGTADTGLWFPAADTVAASTAGTERLRIDSSGNVGIGGAASTIGQLRISGNGSGATNFNGISLETSVQSDITSAWRGLLIRPTTQATAFTLSNLYGVYVNPQTFGAGSSVTNQYGFHAESSLTGATNNYGFYGNIASGTNRYNLYMNGTADNYLAGSLGIGTTPVAGQNFNVGKNLTGSASAYGPWCFGTIQSDVTSQANLFQTTAVTAAAAFTLTNLRHYGTFQSAFGAGSTVTNQMGFYANSALTGATNNYGFYGDIASGTGRFNLYMNGTAANYLGGATTFNAAITYGGITLTNAVTGTGKMVLDTSPTVNNPTVTNYVETLQAVGTVGSTSTLALTTGTVLTATLTASTPCTFTMPTATAGKSFILILTQAATGMTTATFTSVKYPGGTAPTITATASAVDILTFVANGTSWFGTYAQAFA